MINELDRVQNQTISKQLFEDIHKKYFWEIYNDANNTKPIIRFFIGLFYSLGFILISIVLIQNLLYV